MYCCPYAAGTSMSPGCKPQQGQKVCRRNLSRGMGVEGPRAFMMQADVLEEAGTASALVDQHYLPALKAHGWAADGCIIAAADSSAPLAFHLAARLMQLFPPHPATNQMSNGRQATVPPTVEALVLVQSSGLQSLAHMAMQPWYKAKEAVRSARPELDMRAFATQGIHLSRAGDHSSQMVRHNRVLFTLLPVCIAACCCQCFKSL